MTTSETIAHYDSHLRETYVWMCGGMEPALQAGRAEILAWSVPHHPQELVLDLGCGFGKHTLPLLEAGARVHAVDSSQAMLDLLTAYSGAHPALSVECGDLLTALDAFRDQASAILCLGDTLTHLPDAHAVGHVLQGCYDALAAQGMLALSFRDYCGPQAGERKEIPVRADLRRRVDCRLEFEDEHVVVTDVICEHESGEWVTRPHAYRKLRLAPKLVEAMLADAGFHPERLPDAAGMVRIAARKLRSGKS